METTIIYVILSVIISVLISASTVLPRKPKYSEHLHKLGITIAATSFIINISYTYAFGWNARSQSTIELVLDVINGAVFVVGLCLMYSGVYLKFNKKGV